MISLFLSVFMLSQAAMLVKFANMPSAILGLLRVSVTVVFIATYFLFTGRSWLVFKTLLQMKSVWAASFFFYLHFLIWFFAVRYTTAGNATLFFCLNPMFVAIFGGLLFKHSFNPRLILTFILGFLGLVAVEWGQFNAHSEYLYGDLLSLLASIVYSFYVLTAKNLREKFDNWDLLLAFNVLSIGFFALSVWCLGQRVTSITGVQAISILGLSIGPSLLGHGLFSFALKEFSAAVASCVKLSEPVYSMLLSSLFLGEELHSYHLLGFLLIAAALIYLFWPQLKSKTQPTKN